MAFRFGINPRTKQESSIGNNCFDKKAQTAEFTAADPDANMEDAVGLIDE